MMNRIYELGSKNHWSSAEYSLAVRLVDEASPMVLHSVGKRSLLLSKEMTHWIYIYGLAFEPVLNSQGSPELIAQWGNLVANRGILGCYLQTVGHPLLPRIQSLYVIIPGARPRNASLLPRNNSYLPPFYPRIPD